MKTTSLTRSLPWAALAGALLAVGCSGGRKHAGVPMDIKPLAQVAAVEMFEKVLKERGYETKRSQPIYVVGFGEWSVDLWVEGDKLPLVIEYLNEDDRAKLGGVLKSSKAGDKFNLVAVATRKLEDGESLTQENSRFAVIFDDADYVYQHNPSSEERYEVTHIEIEKRLRKDAIDVVDELERVLSDQKTKD